MFRVVGGYFLFDQIEVKFYFRHDVTQKKR